MYTEGIDYDGVRNSLMQEYGLIKSSGPKIPRRVPPVGPTGWFDNLMGRTVVEELVEAIPKGPYYESASKVPGKRLPDYLTRKVAPTSASAPPSSFDKIMGNTQGVKDVVKSSGIMPKLAPYGIGAAIAGTVGTLGYAAKTQMEDKRKPLFMQVFDANTALGSGARVVGLVGASILAASAANEMTRSRQGSQHI